MAEKPAVKLETAASQPTHFRGISENIEKIGEFSQKISEKANKSAETPK